MKWERDGWLISHFYPGRDAFDMTVPEFMSALENIGPVTNELRPKKLEEVTAEMAMENQERYKRNRKIREQQAEAI